jgi:hypothetical protein
MTAQLSGSLLALLSVVGCRDSAAERDVFAVEAARVRSLTPTGGRVDGVGEVVREPLRVSQQWRCVLQTDWATFAAEAARSLAATYRCTLEAERLSCTRSMPGDQFSLSYTLAQARQAQARLEARPD